MITNYIAQENTKLNLEEIKTFKANLLSKPIQFNIDLTGRCNINPPCVFCSLKSDGYQYNALDISAVDAYSEFLSRCERVVDCSFGEPLTCPDFLKLVQKVAENGQAFNFATNGLLLTPKRADFLAEAGENIGFSISINAATAETYHKLTGQSFDRVIENTKYFIKKYKHKWGHNPALAMSLIVMKVNSNEVADFLRLTHSLGISRINLRHLFDMPGSRPRDDFGYKFIYSDEILTSEEYESIGNSSKTLAQHLGIDLIIHWEPSGSAINDLAVPGVNIPCLFPWKFLFVQEHSKNVYMCCYSNAAVGSVKTDSLDQVWNNKIMMEVRDSLGSGKIPEFCKTHGLFCPLVLKTKHKGNAEPAAFKELSSEIVMGGNDIEQLAGGWHDLEDFPPRVRWTTRKAYALMRIVDQHSINLKALTYYPAIKNHQINGHIEIDDVAIGDFTIVNSEWKILKFNLPKQSIGKIIKVAIVIHEPWIPAEIMFSSDHRELGIAVSRIWAE